MLIEIVQAVGAMLAGFLFGWSARGLIDKTDKVTHGRTGHPG